LFYVELHNGHVVGVHKSHMATQGIPSTAKVDPSIVPGKGTTKNTCLEPFRLRSSVGNGTQKKQKRQ
jgi:hypothetical protein